MDLSVNKIIKCLILSDLVFYSAWGLIAPIFAIFIVNNIVGGTVFVVAMATSIHWILKSALRVPFGLFLDKFEGEEDDYFFMVVGLFVSALIPFGYIISTLPWHIYTLQAVYAVGMAMSLSGWSAIFTRHIDKGKESTEWGLNATGLGIGIGVTAAIGGWAVTQFGFTPVFIAVGIFGLLGVALLLAIKDDMRKLGDNGHPFSLKDIFHKERKMVG